MKKSLFIFLCTFLFHAAHADFGRFTMSEHLSEVQIPFVFFDNKVVLPVKINHALTLNFLFDTGVNQPILLSKRWAKQLGFQYHRNLKFHGAGAHNLVSAKTTYPDITMELPGIRGNNMTMVVLDRDPLEMEQYDIHGLIGAQLLLDFIVEINYPRQLLTLRKKTSWSPSPDFQAVDIRLQQLKPFVPVWDGDQSMELLVDLGASHQLILFRTKIPSRALPVTARGLGGVIQGYMQPIPKLSINGVVFEGVAAFITKAKEYSKSPRLKQREGSIGGGLFKGYIVILDYSVQKMYLKPDRSTVADISL